MARSVGYRVRLRVRGELDPEWWSGMFDGLATRSRPDGSTVVAGQVRDQAALHGLLTAIRDVGLTILSIETAACAEDPAAELS